jgi:osmotically-inducible protein OsmY
MKCFNLARATFLLTILAPFAATEAQAQFNPLTLVGKAVSTAMDVRTKSEVAADAEIAAGASKRLLEDKTAEWKSVTLLVFGRHVVLAGSVGSPEARKRVNELVLREPQVRSVIDELVLRREGDDGSFVKDKALDTKIDAVLTAAQGISSVNMRWKSVNGHVVIMGVAQSAEEAKLALAKIRGLDGVNSVKSRLRIVAAKK